MPSTPVFSPTGYEELMRAIQTGGYGFSEFGKSATGEGRVLLRHDIDKHIGYALEMARMEHRLGVRAHYFFLLHCPLYNIMEPESWHAIQEIHQLGHVIGLHCDERRIPGPEKELDAGVLADLKWLNTVFTFAQPVVSFHNPSEKVICRKGSGYVSAYDPAFWMPETKYISDSNQRFREEELIQKLKCREWPRLQILIHPLWWFSEGKPVFSIIQDVVAQRAAYIDAYLIYSNHVWNKTKSGNGEGRATL
ncbi:MAG: hypothetical protein A2268_15395 [Candidatus Raymondbacteria bacterium RifOxyA12_full_50_37]|uniref:NodB homology domain-containing protein n=1 Tax=Candidatus Raymondbacteria bacterium RIFOXYD12_FULL_49_13 TaxID=1817890 RepID=A0A1F7F736_UNCRA|nr:MAG: hypothetical protein A2268_15395 [Candidatus Raymondbacteria bacterium RifOxyA12_full_50_37]OGJ88462.1 MAG: hypothetical protein A2248_19870 [Candidatus Raymondbacteria bacterium RIFOXYA2_FULL_49_16]OGJ98922.1 MAG: hypothetical protein A2453_10585 [Candidatus Raymondbacteria bacterium RIFOXYC2_FULL_50_21]OGK02378.1 MAG: hypothetical protein A2519_16035 [Candidatus Raymondbacteria bacterium RIFOXYD12_FULL_49_13]OGK07918.1 MAG: hypothetical protein A2487_12485 [Candidatus Raymondbacteria 